MRLQFNDKMFDLETSTRLARRWTGVICHFEELYVSAKGNHYIVYDFQPMPHAKFQQRILMEKMSTEQVRDFMLKCENCEELLNKYFNETLEVA